MKVGIACGGPGPWSSGDYIRRSAQAAERHGFTAYYFGEHIVQFGSYKSRYPYSEDGSPSLPDPMANFPEVVTAMTWAAAATQTIEVATDILILPQRNPLVLAKELSCLDDFSNGRVLLGVGNGWCQDEAEALGIDWSRRGKLSDEYIDVMRTIWGNDAAEFNGPTMSFKDAYMHPAPVRDRKIPILIGGDSDAALRRIARRGDGWAAFSTPPDKAAERIALLKQMTRDEGRDPEALRLIAPIFAWTTPGEMEGAREAGFNEFRLYKWKECSLDDVELNDQLAQAKEKYVDVVASW